MSITLICISYQDRPPTELQEIHLDRQGGTIGRAPENDFVVEDPERFASNHHCRIFYDKRGYCIEDTSSNGTLINNEKELFRGETHILQTGDTLTIGDCVIEVEVHPEGSIQKPPVPQRPDPIAAQTNLSIDEAFSFTKRNEQGASTGRAESPNEAVTTERPIPAKSPTKRGRTAQARQGKATPERQDRAAPARKDKAAPARRPRAQRASTKKPRAKPKAKPKAQEKAAPVPPPVDNEEADQIRLAFFAFLSELEMEPQQLAGQDIIEFMQTAGMILRTLADGMMEILKARNAVKKSFKMDTTKIKSVQNNALKFSGTPQEAIYRMLTKQQGFLTPLESVNEAVQDAKAHQVAMVSGMNAAIHSFLSSFDPKKLEKTLDQGFAISKKSKYWDLYNEKYAQIAHDLELNFNDLFAGAFRQSYEEQVRKVEDERT